MRSSRARVDAPSTSGGWAFVLLGVAVGVALALYGARGA